MHSEREEEDNHEDNVGDDAGSVFTTETDNLLVSDTALDTVSMTELASQECSFRVSSHG